MMNELNVESVFMKGGNFYKGNLHSHTRLSDGSLPPEEVVRLYKEAGYAFLGISDHNRYFNTTEFDTDDFILIPAIEWSVREPKDGIKGHHIHGIWGTSEMIRKAGDRVMPHLQTYKPWVWEGPGTVQRCVDTLRDAGNLTIYNHPVWSRLEMEDLLRTEFFGLEIFNYGCDIEDATSLSTLYWDQLLRRGRKVYGFASDDSHFGGESKPGDPYYCAFGGWIVVIAKELTREALAEAMLRGSFYSSSGPEIYDYQVEGEEIVIRCSPVSRINFIAYERRGRVFLAREGETISEARYPMYGDETFVRVECIDERGRTAWTNPIFVKDWY